MSYAEQIDVIKEARTERPSWKRPTSVLLMIQRDKARRALAVVEAERDRLRAELDEAHAIIRDLTAKLREESKAADSYRAMWKAERGIPGRPGRTAKVIRQGKLDHSYSNYHESEGSDVS
jgi:hypothetical protein